MEDFEGAESLCGEACETPTHKLAVFLIFGVHTQTHTHKHVHVIPYAHLVTIRVDPLP